MSSEQESLKGLVPESWYCIDCGFNTAPGFLNRVEKEKAIAALGDRWSATTTIHPNVRFGSKADMCSAKGRVR